MRLPPNALRVFYLAGLYATAGVAAAQSYPSKPIRMVTAEAGGSHGLQNDSDKPLLVMVIDYKITREEKLETEKVPLHLRGAASDMIAEIEKTRST